MLSQANSLVFLKKFEKLQLVKIVNDYNFISLIFTCFIKFFRKTKFLTLILK